MNPIDLYLPFRPATTHDRYLNTRTPPPSSVSGVETELRRFLRSSVTKQLRERDHEDLAVKLEEETKEILPEAEDMKEFGEMLRQMADKLNDERSQEFENMCEKLCLSQHNARNKFRRTIEVLFSKGISWNNIVSMVTFTGHVAVFCADQNMEEQTVEVVEEADTFIHDRLLPWILEKGGWKQIVQPFHSFLLRMVPGIDVLLLWFYVILTAYIPRRLREFFQNLMQ